MTYVKSSHGFLKRQDKNPSKIYNELEEKKKTKDVIKASIFTIQEYKLIEVTRERERE